MAAVSLSLTPVQLSAMSTRRLPLASNPNVANSPLRAASASLAGVTKRARAQADVHRDDMFGQPPPSKRQMVDHAAHQRVPPSPSRLLAARTAAQRAVSARSAVPLAADRSAAAAARRPPAEKESNNIKQWRVQTRARFPKMVFYFESISDDARAKLVKQVTLLGAREEKFFSIEITHIVTSRSIPAEKPTQDENSAFASVQALGDQPKTIDPSLLNRASALVSKKRSVFDIASGNNRRAPAHQVQEEAVRRPKTTRSSDILLRAQAMGKKIWSLDKLQKILDVLLETDAYKRELGPQLGHHLSKSAALRNDNILRSLIAAERDHGPADRDPTVATKELVQFKGPYIYVYDIDEKTKPIMVREYAKVADKRDGEWPQFRIASQGRCPFVEDLDMADNAHRPHTRTKERASKVAVVRATAPSLKPPQGPPAKLVTGSKRSLAQMEDGQSRGGAGQEATADSAAGASAATATAVTARDLTAANAPGQNAFMSRARAPHFMAGEPVASGLQASTITSAIRSQMVSSTTGVLGAKAGTSREIHGLQRKVLQKASTPAVSTQDLSSRQMAEPSYDSNNSNSFARPASMGSRKLDAVKEEDAVCRQTRQASRLLSRQESGVAGRSVCDSGRRVKKPRRDPKPGYCENCMDKFDDFDEHVVSRKHRRFADNDDNWVQLDSLLTHLKRQPRPDEDEY